MRNRSENQRRGIRGEERIKSRLEKFGFSVEKLSDGEPDFLIKKLMSISSDWLARYKSFVFVVEAKSIHGVQRGKVGAFYIEKNEMNRLMEGARQIGAPFVIVVEIITRSKENLYYWIDGVVANWLQSSKGLSLTVWQIIRFGKRI